MLPTEYAICQGFIRGKEAKGNCRLSKQCDIIIYRKEKGAIIYFIGDLKVVNTCSTIAVIEVKSSIQEKTFYTTLKAFKQLQLIGVANTFLFVYGKLSRNNISDWLFTYKMGSMTSDIFISDSYIYDWPDKEWLPKSITSIESESFYSMEYFSCDNGDTLCYTSYEMTDKEDKRVSCLQEFLMNLMSRLDMIQLSINLQKYSIKNGIFLFRF